MYYHFGIYDETIKYETLISIHLQIFTITFILKMILMKKDIKKVKIVNVLIL